jgi:hypothetical protein
MLEPAIGWNRTLLARIDDDLADNLDPWLTSLHPCRRPSN